MQPRGALRGIARLSLCFSGCGSSQEPGAETSASRHCSGADLGFIPLGAAEQGQHRPPLQPHPCHHAQKHSYSQALSLRSPWRSPSPRSPSSAARQGCEPPLRQRRSQESPARSRSSFALPLFQQHAAAGNLQRSCEPAAQPLGSPGWENVTAFGTPANLKS